MNAGDESEGIWLMDFINLYEIEQRNRFKWGGKGVEEERQRG
jgi:hypothetical protein